MQVVCSAGVSSIGRTWKSTTREVTMKTMRKIRRESCRRKLTPPAEGNGHTQGEAEKIDKDGASDEERLHKNPSGGGNTMHDCQYSEEGWWGCLQYRGIPNSG